MNQNKILGVVAMICAPFLFIDFVVHGTGEAYQSTSVSGLFELIYMTGWTCSIIGLYRLNAAGNKLFGKIVLITQFVFISIANIWNIWVIIQPNGDGVLFHALDFFWPISNAFMLITGITVVAAKNIIGWRRFIPLIVGLWLPITIILNIVLGKALISVVFAGTYSAIAWMFLGYAIATSMTRKKFLLRKNLAADPDIFSSEFAIN